MGLQGGWVRQAESRLTRAVLLALAAALALGSLVPWAIWMGYAPEADTARYGPVLRGWIAGSLGLGAAALTLGLVRRRPLDERVEAWRLAAAGVPGHTWALAAAASMMIAGVVLSSLLFAGNPHLVDSIAQLFQARIFAGGGLTAPAPGEYEFFGASHLVRHDGRWFAQYPPGHSALLALGLIVHAPALINPILAAGTVLLMFGAGRRILGTGSAKLAVVLYLLSPFALFMSASFMNHVSTAFFLTLALYGASRAVHPEDAPCRSKGIPWPAVTGLALAAAATIRPLDAIPWAVVLGGWILWRRGLVHAAMAGASCLLGLVPLLAYNAITTGSPLRFGYTLLWGSAHGLGFHTDPWGEPFTAGKSVAMSALDLVRLNDWLLGWPYPSLLFVIVALVIAAWRGSTGVERRAAVLLSALLAAAPVAYFFYWHRDDYLGPRFLFSSVVPAILLTAAGISWLDRRAGRWRTALRLFVVIGLMFGLAGQLPTRAGGIAGQEPEMKLRPEDEVDRLGVRDAIVFVKVGWGSRLISRLWAWDVPAWEAEQSFRAVDGCRIQMALDRADSLWATGASASRVRADLRERLRRWRGMRLPVVSGLHADASVRADTSRALDPVCRQQDLRDRTGFTLYGTLVWRNDPWLADGIIYARDLGPERNAALMMRYPDRSSYMYAPLSPARGAPVVLRPVRGIGPRGRVTEAARGMRSR